MSANEYCFSVAAESERDADVHARALADSLREITGVMQAEREKQNKNTMDLGVIINILATSGATVALAKGVADWLRSHRACKLTIERDVTANSIKATVENIDPDSAKRIIEMIKS
ncbi:effector-associated constant component EACC1 [Paraburkholderia caffeinitolerans]|uniref:effector-associated constant component EACC1 n=1 Tax=Paraburkholderia caffeinitolerans TaxID=1723730 RepID=UPI0015822B20|nr:hypothetical protein [Paraburkholderia caffeinitolerans]